MVLASPSFYSASLRAPFPPAIGTARMDCEFGFGFPNSSHGHGHGRRSPAHPPAPHLR